MNDFQVSGMRELEAALDALPERLEKNIARGALRAGAAVIRDEARSRAPVVSGALQKSIRVVERRPRNGVLLVNVVAGRNGKGRPWYARLVEFGAAPHMIRAAIGKTLLIGNRTYATEVHHPGAAPKPFMRPAFDTKARAAVEAFRDYVAKRLDQLKGS